MKKADLVEVTKMAVSIFDKKHIIFSSDKSQIFHKLDKINHTYNFLIKADDKRHTTDSI